MIDAKRVFAEKRIAILAVSAMVIIAVGLQVVFLYPRTRQVEGARLRKAGAERGLANAEHALQTARSSADGQSLANSELQQFYTEVLPLNLAGAREITSPNLAALARRHHLLLQRRRSVPERDDDSALARLRTTMLLAGDWRNIRRFIYELETASDFIVIDDIVLSQTEDAGSSLLLTLELATYYLTEEET